jgi:hypothetical protein
MMLVRHEDITQDWNQESLYVLKYHFPQILKIKHDVDRHMTVACETRSKCCSSNFVTSLLLPVVILTLADTT